MKEKIKVLLADDHNLFRTGVIKLLKEQENIIVIGEASNGNELFTKYFELSPDVILVDIAMPEMSGPEAVIRIKKEDPGVKALFLSMYEGEEYIYRVLKSGGHGLINKSIMEDELIRAIEKVNEGEKYFEDNWDEARLLKLIEEFESGKKSSTDQQEIKLNYREEQILKLLHDGLSSREMAEKLNLSKKTVDFYRSCLMKKLNLKSPSDLIRVAVQKYSIEGTIQNHSK
jgi:DNA-binding NarL/FixJ family response regulator